MQEVITQEEAEEMIFEADTDGSGVVTWREFLDMITAVYEPGWMTLWLWRLRKSARFFHDIALDGEFDQVTHEQSMSTAPRLVLTDGGAGGRPARTGSGSRQRGAQIERTGLGTSSIRVKP